MKNLLFILAAIFAFSTIKAQENTSAKFNPDIHIPDYKAHPVAKPYQPQFPNRNRKNHNRVTSSTTVNAWFDYYDANYVSGTGVQYAFNVYPDSNLFDPVTSSFITCHGIGMSFDPVDNGYYTPGGVTSGVIDNSTGYTIDSFSLLDKYIMNNPTVTGVDSEVIDLVLVDSFAGDGTYMLHCSPSTVGAYTIVTTNDTPHYANTDYNPSNALTGSKNDCWDSITTEKQHYAFPLTAAVAADTNASGYHVTQFALSPALVVPAGDKVVAYVHFVSAVNYPLGTVTTAANYCQIFAGDPTGNFPLQSNGSYQCGLISQQQNAYGYNVFAGHDLLFTPFDFINQASPPASPFGFEVPHFSFHIGAGTTGSTVTLLPIFFYYDLNSDCIKETTEPYNLTPILVEVDSNSIPLDTISTTSGIYYPALGDSGTIYSFRVIPGGCTASCLSATIFYDTIVSTGYTYPEQYYGLSCTDSSRFDLELNTNLIAGRHMATGIIMLNNNYCTPENAVVTMNFSPKYVFDYSSPSPTSIAGNTITWDLSSVSLATGVQDINFQLTISGTYLTAGDTVNSNYMVTPVTGDLNPANNYCVIVSTVTSSYDPNVMSVSPSGCIAVDTVTPLQYTISFMNVGNDTAFNISVMDTLSDNVDPKSLRIVMVSNTMNISMLNDGTHNIVKFDFPAINLLDSTVCPQCSGAVIFTVKTMQGLPAGTTVYNRAGVFFDDNPVVMTNTVEDIMGGCFQASVNNVQPGTGNITIYPSPATDQLTIKMDQNAYASFAITNSIGQQLIQQPLTLTQTNVNVSSLSPGLYYITFRGDNGTSVQKFVKL